MWSMWEYEIADEIRLREELELEYPLPAVDSNSDDPWINPQTTAHAPPF